MSLRKHLAWLPLLVVATVVQAADRPPGPPPGCPPKRPPAEAIAACNGLAEGAQVSFVDRRGMTRTGVCETFGDVLAVRPTDMPPPPPPPAGAASAPRC
jgi:hypothetical protein